MELANRASCGLGDAEMVAAACDGVHGVGLVRLAEGGVLTTALYIDQSSGELHEGSRSSSGTGYGCYKWISF